jgi:hypothetical protein
MLHGSPGRGQLIERDIVGGSTEAGVKNTLGLSRRGQPAGWQEHANRQMARFK